jgi:hypothetical protein
MAPAQIGVLISNGFFYKAFEKDDIERFEIPYQDAFLPAMRIPAVSEKKKGTIIIHGGFDSFMEEFYSWMRHCSDRGYEVIAFEGPGQGAARRKHGLALDIFMWNFLLLVVGMSGTGLTSNNFILSHSRSQLIRAPSHYSN